MEYVYIVMHHYDYEGDDIDGVYSSLEEARKHKPEAGDRQTITRWKVDTNEVKEFEFTH